MLAQFLAQDFAHPSFGCWHVGNGLCLAFQDVRTNYIGELRVVGGWVGTVMATDHQFIPHVRAVCVVLVAQHAILEARAAVGTARAFHATFSSQLLVMAVPQFFWKFLRESFEK